MTDRPILFSSPMIRAILSGSKSQTRRILKPQPLMGYTPDVTASKGIRFAKGDRLWVRETLRRSNTGSWHYVAGLEEVGMEKGDPRIPDMIAWAHHKDGDTCVSIHMPRWASRLTLTVTDVRVERLQDISEADAIAEGAFVAAHRGFDHRQTFVHRNPAEPWQTMTPRAWYHELWDTINGAGSWDANPWVVAVSFKPERRNIDG